jgi:UV DNA damage endonuclease
MKIGYPCINLSLNCRSSRTFRLASYSEERMRSTIKNNLECLMKILEFNVKNNLLFFRITSDLIPFASHPVCKCPWQKEFKKSFRKIGNFIIKHKIRATMHPDQFTLINSPDRGIFNRSVRELRYHSDVLDLLGTDLTAKIQIHVGGAYGNKEESTNRFIRRFRSLPARIKDRLVIENDERSYSVKDCISVHGKTGIPVVFDTLHHGCNSGGETMLNAFSGAHATWKGKDGLPIVDYSSQDSKKKKGAHSQSIQTRGFKSFINRTKGFDFDIMFEIKDKEQSALQAFRFLHSKKTE